jgi:hypothetical protein
VPHAWSRAFAEVSKEEGFVAQKWPYVLAVDFFFLILHPCCIARGGPCVVCYVLFRVRSYIKSGLLLKGKWILPLHFILYN